VTGSSRPKPAGRDRQLYGDEYDRMMFGNEPIGDIDIVLSNVYFLESLGSLANARVCFLNIGQMGSFCPIIALLRHCKVSVFFYKHEISSKQLHIRVWPLKV